MSFRRAIACTKGRHDISLEMSHCPGPNACWLAYSLFRMHLESVSSRSLMDEMTTILYATGEVIETTLVIR